MAAARSVEEKKLFCGHADSRLCALVGAVQTFLGALMATRIEDRGIFYGNGAMGIEEREMETMGRARGGMEDQRHQAGKCGIWIKEVTLLATAVMVIGGPGPRLPSALSPQGRCSCVAWHTELARAPIDNSSVPLNSRGGSRLVAARLVATVEPLGAVTRACPLSSWTAFQTSRGAMRRMLKATKAVMALLGFGPRFGEGQKLKRRRGKDARIDGQVHGLPMAKTPARCKLDVGRRARMTAEVQADPLRRERGAKTIASLGVEFQPPEDVCPLLEPASVVWTAASWHAHMLLQELIVLKVVLVEATRPRPARASPSSTAVLRLPAVPIPTFVGQVVL